MRDKPSLRYASVLAKNPEMPQELAKNCGGFNQLLGSNMDRKAPRDLQKMSTIYVGLSWIIMNYQHVLAFLATSSGSQVAQEESQSDFIFWRVIPVGRRSALKTWGEKNNRSPTVFFFNVNDEHH